MGNSGSHQPPAYAPNAYALKAYACSFTARYKLKLTQVYKLRQKGRIY
jgi:hypothetical protein